jgi:hypothetical protein
MRARQTMVNPQIRGPPAAVAALLLNTGNTG